LFGRRSGSSNDGRSVPLAPDLVPGQAPAAALPSAAVPVPAHGESSRAAEPGREPSTMMKPSSGSSLESRHSEAFYEVKSSIFAALIEAIDLSQLSKLDSDSAREEIRDVVNEIISIKNIVMSISEQEELLDDICNDVLGYGPLEPVLARDDISDIMVNGATTVYVEKSSARASGSATTSNFSTSASASSVKSAGASMNPRRSAMRALQTAPALTSSCLRFRSTAPPSRSVNSKRTSSPSISWSDLDRFPRKAPMSSRSSVAVG
jgi:hypothetical protein